VVPSDRTRGNGHKLKQSTGTGCPGLFMAISYKRLPAASCW